jgi:hypothetical protein
LDQNALVIFLDESSKREARLILINLEILMIIVYWQDARRGQNLVLTNDVTGREQRIGGFTEVNQRFAAYVTTAEYDPRNSKDGLPTMKEAKAFVESFKPWELYGAEGVSVEPEVRPAVKSSSPVSAAAPGLPTTWTFS